MLVRTADINDLETLLEFEQGVINAERVFDPTLKTSSINYYDLRYLLATPDAEVAVVEEDAVIIASGYALIKESRHWHQHSHYAYLGFMYVTPAHRGKGVNQLILEHLTQWARSKNLTEIRLEVYTGNESAIKAYEKFGFSPLLLEMRLPVK